MPVRQSPCRAPSNLKSPFGRSWRRTHTSFRQAAVACFAVRMCRMTSPDFWIATATASPVIALAAVVATRDALALYPTLYETGFYFPNTPTHGRFHANVSYWLAAFNVWLQALVLYTSLANLCGRTLVGCSISKQEASRLW